jgi:hypothetical protein
MNKAEFTDRVPGLKYEDIDAENWDIINTVYAYHPIISDTNGKKEIADLYKKGGMGIMNDMYSTAKMLQDNESQIQRNSVVFEKMVKEHKDELDALLKKHRDELQVIKDDTATANEIMADINGLYSV